LIRDRELPEEAQDAQIQLLEPRPRGIAHPGDADVHPIREGIGQ
jgi:hypothetical protein